MSDESPAEREARSRWKSSLPYLYDWFTNHNLTWPSLSCRSALLHQCVAELLLLSRKGVRHGLCLCCVDNLQVGALDRGAHLQAAALPLSI